MKTRTLPAWLDDERTLLRYLVSPHEGHAYAEDLIDAVSLITSWALVVIAVLAVFAVVLDALL